jgi:hypothetical protein
LLAALYLTACGSKPETETAEGKTEAAKSESAKKPGLMERILPKPITVPAGTVINVRLDHSVGSKINNSGDPFTATVAEPVEVDGKVVIPSGAVARGVVQEAVPLGRFKGGARLRLTLDSVEVKGQEYALETTSVQRAQKGKGKRTAAMIGGGAGAGAIIGGLAGGGKGAAIGAAVGAGAGTAGAAYTGNKNIVLPAESVLSFNLEKAIEVKP